MQLKSSFEYDKIRDKRKFKVEADNFKASDDKYKHFQGRSKIITIPLKKIQIEISKKNMYIFFLHASDNPGYSQAKTT